LGHFEGDLIDRNQVRRTDSKACPSLPKIVIYGAPLRGIAPCGSCHGSLDNKVGSPGLEGQSEVYMREQLLAFGSGNAATTSASRCATSPAR
jgi:cytochrome c553